MKELTIAFLSILIIAAFFFASYFVLCGNIKTTDQTTLLLIGTAYGAVSTNASQIITYWFGTSKSSSDKDKTIANMTEQPKL